MLSQFRKAFLPLAGCIQRLHRGLGLWEGAGVISYHTSIDTHLLRPRGLELPLSSMTL